MPFPPGMTYSWDGLRARRTVFLCLFLGFALITFLLGSFKGIILTDGVFSILVLVWFAVSAIGAFGLLSWRCPRCRKPFFWRLPFGYGNFFARKCVHCDLKIHAR